MSVLQTSKWEDGVLDIYALKEGQYVKQRQSDLLPGLPVEVFCRYITYADQYDAVQDFRQFLRSSQSGMN